MDVAPIIKIFDALLTAGAAVALVATAFFVITGRFPVHERGRQRTRRRGRQGQSLPRPDWLRHCHPVQGHLRSVGSALGARGRALSD